MSDSEYTKNLNSEPMFQSYRWHNDPVVVKTENVPKHIKDKLEAMKSKYHSLNSKDYKISKK